MKKYNLEEDKKRVEEHPLNLFDIGCGNYCFYSKTLDTDSGRVSECKRKLKKNICIFFKEKRKGNKCENCHFYSKGKCKGFTLRKDPTLVCYLYKPIGYYESTEIEELWDKL